MADVTSIVNLMQGIGKDDSTEYLAKLSKTLAYLLNNLDSLNVTSINTSITRVASENGKTIISGALIELSDASGVLRARMGLKTNGTFAFDIYNASGVLALTLNDTGIVLGSGASISWGSISGAPAPYTDAQALAAWVASGYKTYIDATGVYTGTIAANLAKIYGNIELGDITQNTSKSISFNGSANITSPSAAALDLNAEQCNIANGNVGLGGVNSQNFLRGTWNCTNATLTGFTAVWG